MGIEIGGIIIGGFSFVVISLEVCYDISDSIGVVGFYDIGFVGEMFILFLDGVWYDGVGFGFRYNIGIGFICLDFVIFVIGDDVFSLLNFYIGIG